ncbi:MAG: peptide deformylase [Thermosulfidibacteraceae bacterium]
MGILKIRVWPDEVLKKKAKEVTEIGGEIVKLSQDMLETMYNSRGIGLAATQVGVLKRIIVIDTNYPEDQKNPLILINPVIVESEGEEIMEEGCLSLPGITTEVKRAYRILVKGFDLDGRELEIEATGLNARVIQHEIDHLNGKLFIDRIGKVRRELLKKKLKKLKREEGE